MPTTNRVVKFNAGGTSVDSSRTDDGALVTETLPVRSSAPGGVSFESIYSTQRGQFTSYGDYVGISANVDFITGSNYTGSKAAMILRLLASASDGREQLFGTNTNGGTTTLIRETKGDGKVTFYNSVTIQDGTQGVGKTAISDANGKLTWTAGATATSGSYTPTFTGVLNTGTLSGAQGLYTLVDGVYTLSVSGGMATVPTANTITKIKISLPATSTTRSYDGTGVWYLSSTTIPNQSAVVQITISDPSNAYLYFVPSSTTGGQFNFTIQYK